MSKLNVLVVEDDADIRELVAYNLTKEGNQVFAAASGEEGLQIARGKPIDLVILDLMLPGIDGFSVCRELKGDPKTRDVPVIILTAKGEEVDMVVGLNLGADDYMTKPFSPRLLNARIGAVLRRKSPEAPKDTEDDSSFDRHGLAVHFGRHEVTYHGEPVDLTSTEFRLLGFLVRKPGWVFSRQQILDGLHGSKYAITDRAIDVQIVGLRKKLGKAGHLIETVRGVGYRFKE
jgi:two-component system phosphate regulon response regulator PhoB